jgi:hypothetical protein
MKTSKNKFILIALIIIAIIGTVFFLTRNKKNPVATKNEQEAEVINSELIELDPEDRPYISLIPRADGHELKLKIENIPSKVNQIEYELIYTAKDKASGLEMEKGVGDTIKEISKTIERDLLLGTSSCTNGCKYAYDEGVIGGTLSLTFNTKAGQAIYESDFTLTTSSEIKNGGLNISSENFSITAATTTKNDYFVLIKNFGSKESKTIGDIYSIFSNGSGKGKVNSITPNTISKTDTSSLTGDYIAN